MAEHLDDVLRRAQLVAARREGRETRFAATPAALCDAMAWMADVGAAWDDRLARLQASPGRERPGLGE